MAKENETAIIIVTIQMLCKTSVKGAILIAEETESEAINKNARESSRNAKDFDFQNA